MHFKTLMNLSCIICCRRFNWYYRKRPSTATSLTMLFCTSCIGWSWLINHMSPPLSQVWNLLLAALPIAKGVFLEVAERTLKEIVSSICESVFCTYTSHTPNDNNIPTNNTHVILPYRILKYFCQLLKPRMHSIQILFTNYDDPQSSHNTAITALLTQSQQDFIHTFALTVFNDLMVRYGESIQQLPAVVVDIIKDDLCKALIEVCMQQSFI